MYSPSSIARVTAGPTSPTTVTRCAGVDHSRIEKFSAFDGQKPALRSRAILCRHGAGPGGNLQHLDLGAILHPLTLKHDAADHDGLALIGGGIGFQVQRMKRTRRLAVALDRAGFYRANRDQTDVRFARRRTDRYASRQSAAATWPRDRVSSLKMIGQARDHNLSVIISIEAARRSEGMVEFEGSLAIFVFREDRDIRRDEGPDADQ